MSKKQIDPYTVQFKGETLDPYRIADLYQLKDPIIFQLLKKVLRFGRRHKSQKQDVIDTITSAIRWLEIHSPEDATQFKPSEGFKEIGEAVNTERVSNIQKALKKMTPPTSEETKKLLEEEFESRWIPNTGTPPDCEYVVFIRRDGTRELNPHKTADLGWGRTPITPMDLLFYQPAPAPDSGFALTTAQPHPAAE